MLSKPSHCWCLQFSHGEYWRHCFPMITMHTYLVNQDKVRFIKPGNHLLIQGSVLMHTYLFMAQETLMSIDTLAVLSLCSLICNKDSNSVYCDTFFLSLWLKLQLVILLLGHIWCETLTLIITDCIMPYFLLWRWLIDTDHK